MLNRYKITIISETIKGQFPDGFLMVVKSVPVKKQLKTPAEKYKTGKKMKPITSNTLISLSRFS